MSERVYRLERVGCWIGQISAKRSDAAMKAEVADHVHGVFPLPMGIERTDVRPLTWPSKTKFASGLGWPGSRLIRRLTGHTLELDHTLLLLLLARA